MTELTNPAALEAAALAAAHTPPPIPPAALTPAPPPAPAPAPSNDALHTACASAISSLNAAITSIAQAGTVNSDLALATASCKQAISWLTAAAATKA